MSNPKKYNKSMKKKTQLVLFIALVTSLIVSLVAFYTQANPKVKAINEPNSKDITIQETEPKSEAPTLADAVSIPAAINENGDVVINEADITGNASFIEYESKKGITVGLVAVRASDGTVRTALDTCEVCNGSPYAYFAQDGDSIQCQNCGNVYSVDMIQLERGGCNPIPIMSDEKTVTETEIIIPSAFLEENALIFENWKKF